MYILAQSGICGPVARCESPALSGKHCRRGHTTRRGQQISAGRSLVLTANGPYQYLALRYRPGRSAGRRSCSSRRLDDGKARQSPDGSKISFVSSDPARKGVDLERRWFGPGSADVFRWALDWSSGVVSRRAMAGVPCTSGGASGSFCHAGSRWDGAAVHISPGRRDYA